MYTAHVKLVTGKVENGKVALPEGQFEEGASVAVLSSDADELGGCTGLRPVDCYYCFHVLRAGPKPVNRGPLGDLRQGVHCTCETGDWKS